MGKTFRRGGAERGYSSPGKSLRDKRQRGLNRSDFKEDSSDKYRSKHNKKKYQNEEYYGTT
tara:strand:+ start:2710 stop:2892 length:183 start_codon:yes stop_codon:yes gene_type:complete